MASRPRRKAISTINEFDLIRALQRRYRSDGPGVLRGIGDDAAVIASEPRRSHLFTTDLLAEGIHFDLATASFVDLGFRAATANLSDIAAMGGTPEYILVSLAIPQSASKVQVEQMYRGLMTACRPHGVRLIGGDTSASATGWFLNITLVGSAPARDVLLRSGSNPGDTLYVTGTLGDSRAGLQLLQHSPRRSRPSISFRHRRFLVTRHLRPTARIREGCWLAKGRWATSAIDISDGLSGDLRHLCEASQVGVDLDLSMFSRLPRLCSRPQAGSGDGRVGRRRRLRTLVYRPVAPSRSFRTGDEDTPYPCHASRKNAPARPGSPHHHAQWSSAAVAGCQLRAFPVSTLM
jgi:thiamine-monophosphate kinase